MSVTGQDDRAQLIAYVPRWMGERVRYEATLEGESISALVRRMLYQRYGYADGREDYYAGPREDVVRGGGSIRLRVREWRKQLERRSDEDEERDRQDG